MVRIKHRYLLIRILYPTTQSANESAAANAIAFNQPTPDTFTPQSLVKLIRDGVSDLFGEYGAGIVGSSLAIKYFSTPTSTALVRVGRNCYRLVWAALTFIDKLPMPAARPCVIKVIRVSGTIRKALESAAREAQKEVWRAQNSNGGDMKDRASVSLLIRQDAEAMETEDEAEMSGIETDASEDSS